jgi:Peptidase family M23
MRLLLLSTAAFVSSLAMAAPARAEWLWPVRGEVITPYRNADDPYAGGQHRGIDIAAPAGSRVSAATAGEVRFAGAAGSSGLTVSLRTADGRHDTSYLHLSLISVREGESVSAGEALGAVGTTGARSASEPHLHFGVREAGTRHAYLNPLDFLPPQPAPPAPETPGPGPAPAPAPRPVAPAPAPATEPAARRVPVGGRVPRRVPDGGRAPRRVPLGGRAPRPAPLGARAPRRVPVEAPRGVPAGDPAEHRIPVTEGERGRVPAGDPAPHGVPRDAPAAAPSPGLVRRDTPATDRTPHTVSDRERTPGSAGARSGLTQQLSPAHAPAGRPKSEPGTHALGASQGTRPGAVAAAGSDVGWILACVGLLVAAGMLGLTEDGRKATCRGHTQLVRLLRPLRGRG